MESARRVAFLAAAVVLWTYISPTEAQASAVSQSGLVCPDGWYRYVPKASAQSTPTLLSPSSMSCVKYVTVPAPYIEAQRQCRMLKSQLVNMNKTSAMLLASAKAATLSQNYIPCNVSLSGKGIIQSPNFPDVYPDNLNCQWNVQVKNSSSLLFLLSNVNIETCCDYLTITSSSNKMTRIYNSLSPGLLLQSDVNVTFNTDASIGRQGFSILYFSVSQLNNNCSGTVASGNGWVVSPGFPGVYQNSVLCRWTINPVLGKMLLLQFLFCDLEGNYDTVRIYSGLPDPRNLVTSIKASDTDILWNGTLLVLFSTDHSVQKYGFIMRYMSVSAECGLRLRDNGNFTSPGYGNTFYPLNVACVYNISSSNNALTINFTTIDLEPCCDKISIYRGARIIKENLIVTLTDVRSAQVNVPDRFAIVLFTSDNSESRSGFFAYFKSIQSINGPDDETSYAQYDKASSFWTGLHKENEKYYWDAVSPLLDTAYCDFCAGVPSAGYCWNCNDSMSTACAAGQLKAVELSYPRVALSSASCDLELPYFCTMDINISDMTSTADSILGQPWLYNSITQYCYKFVSQPTTFGRAISSCASEASILAAPISSTELAVIAHLPNVSDSWARMLKVTTDVEGDPSVPVLYVVANSTSCLVLQLLGGAPVITGKPCSESFAYICQKDCTDQLVSFNLTLNVSSGTLVCGAPVHNPASIFWTRNGQFVQLPSSQQGLRLKVYGPLAEYRCGITNSTDYTRRIYSNPVLATELGNTAIVYRIVITALGSYSAKYVYYSLKYKPVDILAEALTAANLSRNAVVLIDSIRPSSAIPGCTDLYFFVSLQPLLSSSQTAAANVRDVTNSDVASTYTFEQLQTFQTVLNTSIRAVWTNSTADLIVRHPFYCLAFNILLNNAVVYFGRTPIGDTAVIPGCCYASCGGNFTVGGIWGPVVTAYATQALNVTSTTPFRTSELLTGMTPTNTFAVSPSLSTMKTTVMTTTSQPVLTGSTVTLPSPSAAEATVAATTSPHVFTDNVTAIAYTSTTESLPTFNVTYTAATATEADKQQSSTTISSTTDVFRKFVEGDLSTSNVHEVGMEIVRLTDSTASLTSHDVADAAAVVSRMANLMTGGNVTETLYAVPSLIGRVVGNLMNANESTLSASKNGTTISLQASLESSLLALSGAAFKSGTSINSSFLRLQEDNLAYQIVVDPSINGLRIGAAPSLKQAILQPLRTNESDSASSDSTTVRLSPSVADAPKTFLIFNNSKLFRANSSLQSDGSVVSVQIAAPSVGRISGLVTLVFNNIAEARNGSVRTCGFWNYTSGDWSSEGCAAILNNNGSVTCTCDHLTNFAALLAVKNVPPIDKVNAQVLDIISFIGLAISIVCLTAVIMSFLALKKMRRTVSQKVLFNLALSLLALDVLFVVGIDRTDSKGGCIAVAALLHYFLLASFMWMLMESILQYLRFVKVLGTYIPRFIIKTAIPAWGAPALVVAIVCGTNLDLYFRNDGSYCFATEEVVYYGVLLPIGAILVVNFVMFGIVIKNVCCRKKKFVHHSKHSEKSMALLHAQAGIAICVVLGLTWIFGFLTPIPVVSLPFQYLFCICNSLQGLLIFIFHCAREKALRDEWRKRCCGAEFLGWKSTTSTTDDSITMRRSAISMTSAISNSTYGSVFSDEGRNRRKTYEVQKSQRP